VIDRRSLLGWASNFPTQTPEFQKKARQTDLLLYQSR
jgi:hypothetical protein